MLDARPEPGIRISVIVPVYRTRMRHLRQMIDSVTRQDYQDWELILVNDYSQQPELKAYLDERGAEDERITVIHCDRNGGIGRATSIGIAASSGEFVGLLDHDDLLEPIALSTVADAIAAHPDTDVLYTDEYWVDDLNANPQWFKKPEFSPERLRAQMYLGHICFYRRSLLDEIGGMRTGYDGSQDYDLALRATERARYVHHVRAPLYRWRIHHGSVSHSEGNDPVFEAARRALLDHLERIGIDGDVEKIHRVGVYRIHRRVKGSPKVSIVIPTRGSAGMVRGKRRCMVVEIVRDIVERSTYRNVEIVVVWDTGMDARILEQLREIAGDRLVLLEYSEPFNFSVKINRGAIAASGEYLLLLNDDMEVIDPDWIEVLLSMCQVPGVGIAGSLLYFGNGRIQHAGHIYTRGAAGHSGLGIEADVPGFAGQLTLEREVSGITAACAMLPIDVFFGVGGMSTTLPVNYNDVDLSLKVRQAGYRTVVSPFARLYHYESTTREPGFVSDYEMQELHNRWARHMQIDMYD